MILEFRVLKMANTISHIFGFGLRNIMKTSLNKSQKMEVFDQNSSFQMINYCMMDFGIFVLFVCIIVRTPYLTHRFVTFTQKKKEFLCDMTFSTFVYTRVRFTKSDNCGSAAVTFCAYL